MSGSGYRIGMAIAVYELMAAATLVIVAVFFMPVYLKNRIYTMPQFLEQRFGRTVATTMALFWLGLYVVVNLTAILYLGALALHPAPQVRERFLASLSKRLGQPRVSLRRSTSRHCMDSSGRYLHLLADDAGFPLVLHQDPVRRDPLVAALFGAANNMAVAVKGEVIAMN
jgi:hypothetical protein